MLLTRLRLETRDLHEQVERDLNLLRPELNATDYRLLLERFFGFHKRWEQALEAAHPALLRGREKAFLIERDLLALGVSEQNIALLPLCDCMPLMKTNAQVAGAFYVIEGSTLGGQILARHFREWPTSFFGGYADRTGQMWRSSCDFLERQPTETHGEVTRSALATFALFSRWMLPGPGRA